MSDSTTSSQQQTSSDHQPHENKELYETQKNWVPLEANPEVLTSFMQNLGVPEEWEFCDIYGIDSELLDMVPKPCIAVLLLFPITNSYEQQRYKLEDDIKSKGQIVSDKVYFMKQYIGNACGTIGVVHSVLNNANVIKFKDGFFKNFLNTTTNLNVEQRATALALNTEIEKSHEISALQGQSSVPDEDEPVILHFVSFVNVDGHLYELDGRKPFPINHSTTTEATFLEDVSKVLQKMIEENPEEIRFNLMGLVKSQSEEEEEEEEEEEKKEEQKENEEKNN
ncbi:peptidase C12 family protein [Heterostelium album PN500]|uniref:Ubiquitin carboxyl-terminal hydrolase n=1 Tax=Heterostelium pallidum (strain ATCC 26659 / Pp 5 / PN500) TaxID=670386 RepID=D3B429_HETP5|nr:peptidase C12 family protein [Heterostelium album PN500]EFA84077.1 peptidase C12 family protein [Heterostelium album PN500]|eukprot:XP_020436194.1 peptidase C12 family protein [Heterostelium album PN500]